MEWLDKIKLILPRIFGILFLLAPLVAAVFKMVDGVALGEVLSQTEAWILALPELIAGWALLFKVKVEEVAVQSKGVKVAKTVWTW